MVCCVVCDVRALRLWMYVSMLGFHFVDNVVVVVFLNVDCFSLHVQCVVERDCFHVFLDALFVRVVLLCAF